MGRREAQSPTYSCCRAWVGAESELHHDVHRETTAHRLAEVSSARKRRVQDDRLTAGSLFSYLSNQASAVPPEPDVSLRRGRRTSSPSQFGQTNVICPAQLAQKCIRNCKCMRLRATQAWLRIFTYAFQFQSHFYFNSRSALQIVQRRNCSLDCSVFRV